MPHYADGTQAEVGDHVIGKPYNTPHEVAGTIVSISPSQDTCNCQVQFTDVVPLAEYTQGKRPRNEISGAHRVSHSADHSTRGEPVVVASCVDYGEVKAFKLVSRPKR